MNLIENEPTCFNGDVRVLRYKVTVELIEETDEVIRARIQKMLDECDNHHHHGPLRVMDKKYDLELKY